MMQNSITKFFFAFRCLFFAMLMSSCSDEMASVVSDTESETTVSFVFNVTEAKDSVKDGSRAVSSDNTISDITVFIFDQNGNAIGKGKASNATSLIVLCMQWLTPASLNQLWVFRELAVRLILIKYVIRYLLLLELLTLPMLCLARKLDTVPPVLLAPLPCIKYTATSVFLSR